jgi:GNAT superfamily N-acetyltransferase
MRLAPLTPDLQGAWAALFDECASGCFCRYWHFEGTKNDWLARLAFTPRVNEEEQRRAVREGHPSGSGIVALDGDTMIGWMKLTARAAVPKLRRLPVYRALDLGPDEGVLAIACLLVHPLHRKQGVARALVKHAIEVAPASGASIVEAYPHRRGEPLRDEEMWMGPHALFEALGFSAVRGNEAYPVMRYVLR